MEQVTKQDVDDLKADVKTILLLLQGNGDPSKGIIVRLDRIEQWRKQVNWGIVLIGGTGIIGVGKLSWDLLIHALQLVKP